MNIMDRIIETHDHYRRTLDGLRDSDMVRQSLILVNRYKYYKIEMNKYIDNGDYRSMMILTNEIENTMVEVWSL